MMEVLRFCGGVTSKGGAQVSGPIKAVTYDERDKITKVFTDFILVGIEEGGGNGHEGPDKLAVSTVTSMIAGRDDSLLIIRTALGHVAHIFDDWVDKFVGKRL